MTLRQQIQQHIIQAMKAGEKEKLSVLRFLFALVKDKEIEQGRKELTDEEITKLISNQIKKQEESIVLFEKGKRQDLINQAKKEIAILKAYLPTQISDEELAKEIEAVISANPKINHPGALIGLAIKKLAGKADNQRISQFVLSKSRLQN